MKEIKREWCENWIRARFMKHPDDKLRRWANRYEKEV